ncbi:autoinducer binding domain-containing protein [Flavimaricola marinus]|uniref:DNA-binding transcriptional activator SdiA n=1 Tax=Flavimaricola marinus TaxID=1819565 RepID=A0A238LCH7_9RHOB|nr:autoinducer binding domain-containing protein [Flavimaricola marinus]SMY07263.1 DNA-binding transcriptional activator SdiA [Flavimaricola marinus]
MSHADNLISLFDGLKARSPAGFAIGLHLDYTTSKYIFQAYSREWMEVYSRRGFLLSDPTVRWGLENTGHIRWSELEAADPAGVIEAAKGYGLDFGVSVAIAGTESQSLGSFASSEGEFSESAIDLFSERLSKMHEISAKIEPESNDDKRVKRFAASLSGIGLHDL